MDTKTSLASLTSCSKLHFVVESTKYINKFSTDFALQGQSIVCSLIFTQNTPQDSIQFYIDDFRKEVLDQDLREKIKKESEPLRNLILAHAFSKTTLVEQ